MNVSIVIPWRGPPSPLRIPAHAPGDEVLVIREGNPGQARLEGVKLAVHEWIVFTDGDGDYPSDFIRRAKEAIARDPRRRGFRARRHGGIHRWFNFEGGFAVRRALVLERVGGEFRSTWLAEDLGYAFRDLPLEPAVEYHHSLTRWEKRLLALGALGALGLAWFWKRGF